MVKIMIRFRYVAILLIYITACERSKNLSNQGQLLSVPSSSSLVVSTEGGLEKVVRLCGVKSNLQVKVEEAAKKRVLAIAKSGKNSVILLPVKVLRDNSVIAEVFVPTNPPEEKSINAELIINGLADFNPADNCPNNQVFQSVLEEAKSQKVGIWSEKNSPK